MSLSIEGWLVPTVLTACAILIISIYYLADKVIPTRLDARKAPKSTMGLVEAHPCSDIVYDTGAEYASRSFLRYTIANVAD